MYISMDISELFSQIFFFLIIVLYHCICSAHGFKYLWLFPLAGEVAVFGKSSFVGREVSFVVKESLPEDAGAYTCLIENRAGKTSSCSAVFVRGQLCRGIPAENILWIFSRTT